MGFLHNVYNVLRQPRQNQAVSMSDSRLLNWLGIDQSNPETITEATYFTCLKMLSETMGKLPLHYYQQTEKGRVKATPTDATRLLTVRPNRYMTPTTLFTLTEMMCQHYGNGYIYIHSRLNMTSRYKGEMEFLGLYPMHPENVTVYVDNAGIFGNEDNNKAVYYEYRDPISNKSYVFTSDEVIHIKTWYTKNGITSEPVRTILKDTIATNQQSQRVISNLYKNGMTASMVMQYTADLDDDRVKQLQRRFADKLTGPESAGKVIPIPIGLQLQPLNTSFSDAQFYELRKYSALQIAGAFGVKPNMINDYEKSSYSSSEQQQLSFLVDTMQYRLKMWEEELNAKVLLPEEAKNGFFYKFNERAILRTDAKTQMETLCAGVQNAIYKPNEARHYLDMDDADGGDVLMCNGNYVPIEQVGAPYGVSANQNNNFSKGGKT
jgi:HK97 family phage portal protein